MPAEGGVYRSSLCGKRRLIAFRFDHHSTQLGPIVLTISASPDRPMFVEQNPRRAGGARLCWVQRNGNEARRVA
jgi:hypothetical protein